MHNRELLNAVSFICRNSVHSPARTEIIRQVIRCHVMTRWTHQRLEDRNRGSVEMQVREITVQLEKRGYI